MYNSVLKEAESTIEIKKSIFIGHTFFVKNEDEALQIISNITSEYKDATHNCYAYIIGEYALIQRYSDDGEPSGTAGIPMLEVLKKENLRNVLVIVTRYFGGTKLGAGGLVRAYTNAVTTALDMAKRTVRKLFNRTAISYDYTSHGKIINFLTNNEVRVLKEKYSDLVEIVIDIEDDSFVIGELTDLTSGNIEFKVIEQIELPTINNKIIYEE